MNTPSRQHHPFWTTAITLVAVTAFVTLNFLCGCGGHHKNNSKYNQYKTDYSDDTTYPGDLPILYPGFQPSSSSSSSSNSGSSSSNNGLLGTFVDSQGHINQIFGTVDANGFLSGYIVNTATGQVSTGTGYSDSSGDFTITDDNSGDTDSGTIDYSDDSSDDDSDDY